MGGFVALHLHGYWLLIISPNLEAMGSDAAHEALLEARSELNKLDIKSVQELVSWLRSFADRLQDQSLEHSPRIQRARAFEREQARDFLDIAGVVIVAIDKARKVTLINRKGCELLGLSEEEIIGLDWFENFLPESIRKETADVFDLLMEGQIETGEYFENPVISPEGERWVAWHNSVIYDEHGRIQGTLSSGEDITDRRQETERLEERVIERTAHLQAIQSELLQQQEKLQHEKDRAQLYLDVARVALLALDREGKVTLINQSGCALLELREDEILGKNWFDEFVVPREKDTWEPMFAELIRTGHAAMHDGEAHVRTGSGGERLMAWHTTILKDEHGAISGTLTCGEDITDRRRAEEELKSREAQLRLISDSLPVLIARVDKEGRYVFNNAAYETFFGVSPDDLRGTYVRDLIGAQTFDDCMPHVGQVLEGASPVFELQCINKEGDPRDMQVELVRDRGPSGEIEGFYAVITDMTERKELDRALRHSQKMEAVGRLASGIAHDFNNLLMGIGGCSNLALSRLEEDSPARIFIDEIRNAATSGASISRQLLEIGGKKAQEVSNVSLDALVVETEAILRRLLGASISLHIDLHADDGLLQLAPGQVKQILMNLLVNASDATPPGGRIDIETDTVDLGPERTRALGGISPGRYVVLRVRDTGIGMDDATVERIFEPFFTTKHGDKGTGLGLSTVYGIVSGVGGHVDVESTVGEGTVFTVFLPMSEAETRSSKRKRSSRRRGRETVLVVEDDRLVQLAVREYLSRHGYRVLEARDGHEAVQVAREHSEPIPLVVSDMVLPGMSGSEVARAVVKIHPESKVIYMSAHSQDMLIEAGHLQAEEETETLQKPFGEDELLARVHQVLEPPSPLRR